MDQENQSNLRAELEARYGQVWDAEEVKKNFRLKGSEGDCLLVKNADGVLGRLHFKGDPPIYFDFEPISQV